MNDHPPQRSKPLYLNIIWHQHQPLYLDPATDQLQGPWVRTHGTKDYYDMAAMVGEYPDIHVTVNLTSSLLFQLEEYYVERLKPFVDVRRNRVDAKGYFDAYGGKTDPWIDIALKPTRDFDEHDLGFLATNTWNAFGISEVMFGRFPEYRALREEFRSAGLQALSEQKRREVKFWFYLANFDPDFLERKTKLVTGATIDLTDYLKKNDDGSYVLKKAVTEEDCNRIVAETYKVLAAIVPIHKKLMYHPASYKGQIDIVTTPYYHPILPLLYDSDLAKLCQPNDPLPLRFHYPHDADVQVAKAAAYFKRMFGILPTGMWPAEGSVAHDIVPVFARNGIRWIATDEKILARSKPANQPKFYPYALFGNGGSTGSVAIVFRDTELSDKIGFTYQTWKGTDAAEDFIQGVLRYIPNDGEADRLLTVILDGENAWEWYRYDNDGKEFQHALYAKLSKLYETKEVITVSMSEYLRGNPRRGVPAHPIEALPKLEWLWPGSWINANYDTWVGEDEENRAWEYLLTARKDLDLSGVAEPVPDAAPAEKGTKAWYAQRAWDSLYAAEGSDWFWWYGTDQTAPAGDKPFDLAFITHIENIYAFAKKAGGTMPARSFEPIIHDAPVRSKPGGGAMSQSSQDVINVVLHCDARQIYVRKAIYVAGNLPELGGWVPNKVRMYDDGSNGDLKSGDNIWTISFQVPPKTVLEYKFTNSGAVGSWDPGEEFPSMSRRVLVDKEPGETVELHDKFGVM
ncbi:MAG TPA: carbohydrate-binding module family 20 domain-containing protein [Bacteroidota bacterium]